MADFNKITATHYSWYKTPVKLLKKFSKKNNKRKNNNKKNKENDDGNKHIDEFV